MAFPTIDFNLSNPDDLPSPLGYQAVQNVHLAKSLTTAMVATGIVTALAKMPANTRYVDLYATATDLDTNVTPTLTLDLGIAGVSSTALDDDDAFLADSTIGQAGTATETIIQAGMGLLVTVEHWLTLKAQAGAATAAAGTITIGMSVVLP